jgi:hypothetical protein
MFIKILILSFIPFITYSQIDSTKYRLDTIDSTLQMYGKGQTLANHVSLVSVVCVVGGTALGIAATPLLIVTSLCDLTTILVSSRANRKLSKHRK